MKNFSIFLIFCIFAASGLFGGNTNPQFAMVSKENPRYFCFDDGSAWIPNGYNICFPRSYFYEKTADEGMSLMELQFARLAENGGDYVRLWVSADFFDVETTAGIFDEAKFARIDRIMEVAKKYGIRVKFCMQHFRNIKEYNPNINEGGLSAVQKMFLKPAYAKKIASVNSFFKSDEGRKLYLNYIAQFAKRYADNPFVFGIELWNEINAVSADKKLLANWTRDMLIEVKKMFPKTLVMQSVGSYDSPSGDSWTYPVYMQMRANEIAQVHRYLDEGANFEVCRGPVDILAADAVARVFKTTTCKPVILAESGAVNPKHSGPFSLYERDIEGTILHDVMFAPFYSGAAAAGQCWHWEAYILKNNLFWHFSRFAKVIDGINPIAERFVSMRADTKELRVYVLSGQKTIMGWVRDSQSDWKSELRDNIAPRSVAGAKIRVGNFIGGRQVVSAQVYNPWTNREELVKIGNDGMFMLPDFKRSTTFKIKVK